MNGYEALDQLPEDIQKLALTETKNFQSNFEEFMSQDYPNVREFLLMAFYWEISEQGHNFWVEKAGIEPTTV